MKKGAARLIDRRPLALAAFLYALGAAAGCAGVVPAPVWGAGMILCMLLFVLRKRVIYVFCALVFVGAWACAALGCIDTDTPQSGVLTGRIRSVNETSEQRTVATLEDAYVDGAPVSTLIRLYDYGRSMPKPGDYVTCEARLWQGKGKTNPGGFDFSAWLRRGGIGLCATANEISLTPGRPGIGGLLSTCRDACSRHLDAMFGDQALLARAILLGDKEDMPQELYDLYRDAGLAHLMAVSGLHVSCLAAAVFFALNLLGMGRNGAFGTSMLLTVFYVLLTGASPSAIRAACMFAAAGTARIAGRPYDSLTALSCSALILLGVNPLMIGDGGFILSYCAVLGILLLFGPVRRLMRVHRWLPPLRWVGDMLAVSLSAELGALPALCCLFGQIAPYAALAGVPGVLLCTLALPLIGLALLADMVSPVLGAAVSQAPGLLLMLLSEVTRAAASLPGAVIHMPAWSWPLLILFAAAALAASDYLNVGRIGKRAALAVLPACAAAAVIAAWLQIPGGLNCLFLDAGDADAAVITAGKQTYLVDVGNENGPVDDYLRYTGRNVRGVFLTHGHIDHGGGLMQVVKDWDVPVIYLPAGFEEAGADEQILLALDEARKRGTAVRYLSRGDKVALAPDVTAEVLSPGPADHAQGNEASLVLSVTYGNGSVLLTGDLPAKAEYFAVRPAVLLKAAHHGSNDATSEFLLRAVSPAACVISADGDGGHPSGALLERLERLGIRALRTDESGAVSADIYSDGTLKLETYL